MVLFDNYDKINEHMKKGYIISLLDYDGDWYIESRPYFFGNKQTFYKEGHNQVPNSSYHNEKILFESKFLVLSFGTIDVRVICAALDELFDDDYKVFIKMKYGI